ncbi:coiled-coil domain-containing protein 34 [Entelurus aequoreus]|uniref:coiled-coil domain-containing protein 34 n=1 Tax=Entelurus aequoreus TaxID=161455 RepID=UPI002B1E4907|nr:coiled-coil domain-containing protein 34 [Entelurus aequoreus]XP_061891713.1 coiled-coil domain-containing protein 34 [Entelurus aequoreus]
MSGWCQPSCPSIVTKDFTSDFTSTPIKENERKHVHATGDLGANDVLSEDDDTFSLLSPIYHDSYESDEDAELNTTHQTSLKDTQERSVSSLRCDLQKSPSEHMGPEALSAWELWLVKKMKEDQLRLKKKTEEERLLKEQRKRQEIERERKRLIEERKILDWQQMKREQERREHLLKRSKEEAEMRLQQEKHKEAEQKAQQKYKDWLQKKKREREEKEKQEIERACLREEQEKMRRKKAEENFNEWLEKANEKCRTTLKSPHHPIRPWDYNHPPPSFYNPIPWKPIHTPPPESPPENTSRRKPNKQQKRGPSFGASGHFRNIAHR